MNYSQMLSEDMQNTLSKAGYSTPTPIQEQTLEPLMSGRDVIGIAQTGTGKTAAFAVPLIERITPENKQTQALILCPTRELALQTADVLRRLSEHKRLRVVSVYGGQSPVIQIRALRSGAQIVVGTPGRVKDFIGRNVLKLKNVRTAILDEADEMLDYGFLPDIKEIMSNLTGAHQTLLFSATMNKEVAKVAEHFQQCPVRIDVGRRDEPIDTIKQTFISTEERQKPGTVKYLMDQASPRLTLVFCNTRSRVKRLTETLQKQGVASACLHGDLSQNRRDAIMASFRRGQSRVLIATDVAARGIDVDNVDLVINYDVPDKLEYYVHRIGRTGRAGNKGWACTLVSPREKSRILDIQRRYNINPATC